MADNTQSQWMINMPGSDMVFVEMWRTDSRTCCTGCESTIVYGKALNSETGQKARLVGACSVSVE